MYLGHYLSRVTGSPENNLTATMLAPIIARGNVCLMPLGTGFLGPVPDRSLGSLSSQSCGAGGWMDGWIDVFLQRIGPLRTGRSAQHMVDCSTGFFIGTDLRIRRAHHLPSLESECESQNVLGIQSRESCHRTTTLQKKPECCILGHKPVYMFWA